jgi:hypothetical protein
MRGLAWSKSLQTKENSSYLGLEQRQKGELVFDGRRVRAADENDPGMDSGEINQHCECT